MAPTGRLRANRRAAWARGHLHAERGQAAVLLLGVMATLVLGALVLGAFGQALGAKGRHQRAADLAAMSAALAMRDAYPRLFEAQELRPGVPNPRHISEAEYEALARTAAVRGAAALNLPTHGSGGGYDGPLAYRMGKPNPHPCFRLCKGKSPDREKQARSSPRLEWIRATRAPRVRGRIASGWRRRCAGEGVAQDDRRAGMLVATPTVDAAWRRFGVSKAPSGQGRIYGACGRSVAGAG